MPPMLWISLGVGVAGLAVGIGLVAWGCAVCGELTEERS